MNIAFPALLIFLLILPGLIFNSAFYKIEDTPLAYVPFTNKTIISTVVTVILHMIGLVVVVSFVHSSLNKWPLLILISGVQDKEYSAAITSLTTHQLFFFAIYLLVVYLLAYLCGYLLRFLIIRFEWDKYSIFEIDSPWYYLFKGYEWEDGKPNGVQIAAIMEMGGKCHLYIGILKKFFFNGDGNIDRLVLTSAMRREIENDKNFDEEPESSLTKRFYPIDGDYFVLKYSEIKNLNVQFLKID